MLGRQRVRESLLRRGGGGRGGIPPELARGVGGFGWRRGGGGREGGRMGRHSGPPELSIACRREGRKGRKEEKGLKAAAATMATAEALLHCTVPSDVTNFKACRNCAPLQPLDHISSQSTRPR